MKFARLDNNIVVEVIETHLNPYSLFHKDIADKFVEVPIEFEDSIKCGLFYEEGEFKDPIPEVKSNFVIKRESRIASQNYLSKFFSDKELIHMQIQLSLGKSKAQAVYAWIQKGFELCMQYQSQVDFDQIPSNDYSSLGVPPYTYEAVMTE